MLEIDNTLPLITSLPVPSSLVNEIAMQHTVYHVISQTDLITDMPGCGVVSQLSKVSAYSLLRDVSDFAQL